MRRLTLESLEVLDAIDRRGSFAAAAASLHRVPSKITYTVNKLQDDLGVALFRREGRRSVLTPAGRLLLEQGRELLEAADHLVMKTREVDSGWESRLRIALDTLLTMDDLAPHLDAFCRQRPDTEICVATEVLGGTWEAVLDRRADLAIGAADAPPDTPGIEYRTLMKLPWVFAVAPEHPLAGRALLSERERLRHRAVVISDSSRVQPALTRRVFDKQPRLTVSTMEHKIAAQCAGLGAGFLPRQRIAALISAGALVEVDLEEAPPDSTLFIAWRSGRRGRALNWMIESLAGDGVEPASTLDQ